jgi:hypothetical protein
MKMEQSLKQIMKNLLAGQAEKIIPKEEAHLERMMARKEAHLKELVALVGRLVETERWSPQ